MSLHCLKVGDTNGRSLANIMHNKNLNGIEDELSCIASVLSLCDYCDHVIIGM